MSLLEIDSIQKFHKQHKLLNSIYLQINTNDIIAIVGRSGSGKTTLFDVIFGSKESEQKFIRLDGIVKNNAFEIKEGLGFATQFNHFPKFLKVKNLIRLFFKNKSENDIFINDPEIEKILNFRIKDLSYGIQRYLQIKIYLFSNNKFCILDEPFAGLSTLLIDKISNFIVEQSKSKGIIISDHQYDYVLKISTKNYYLKDGHLFSFENKNELINLGYINKF